MADIQYYERVLKAQKVSTKLWQKVMMIGIYLLLLTVWLIIIVRVGISASLLMLIPLSVITVVLLTWKYTSVEYEYSFAAGHFTFSRIYGSSKRKAIYDTELTNLVAFTAYSEKAADSLNVHKIINAIPDATAQNPVICTFEENEQRTAVILDCDEMTLKILKFFKGSAYISFSI